MVRRLVPLDGEHILDVPSGGAYLRSILPAGVRYSAADESPHFHAACPHRLLPGDRALLAPAHDLPVAGGSFDAVCSVAGLHHQPQRLPIYREWCRVLRPGGRLVIADVAEGSAIAGFLNGFVDRYNSQGHAGVFLSDTDVRDLVAAGFDAVSVEDVHYHWRFRDPAHATAFCRGLFGLDRLGAAAALGPVLEAELGLHPEADRASPAGWELPWSLRYLTARKPEAAGAG